MKLENQVVSLDLAKRLKELGVKQESAFFWRHLFVNDESDRTTDDYWELMHQSPMDIEQVAAFTVAELGEMLPRRFVVDGKSFALRIKPDGRDWLVGYTRPLGKQERRETGLPHYDKTHQVWERTEADARAKMLIYLLENKLIDA